MTVASDYVAARRFVKSHHAVRRLGGKIKCKGSKSKCHSSILYLEMNMDLRADA